VASVGRELESPSPQAGASCCGPCCGDVTRWVQSPQQLRQSSDVDGDPSRLVLRRHLCLQGFGMVRGSRCRRAPARWRHGRHSRRALCRHARAMGNGGMSSGGRRAVVWPPPRRRDRQRRSPARTDPARRGKPAWVPESVRLATTVGDLQGDVFIEGSALDRLPTITFRRRRPRCAFPNFRANQYLPALGFNPRPGGRLPASSRCRSIARLSPWASQPGRPPNSNVRRVGAARAARRLRTLAIFSFVLIGQGSFSSGVGG
jgi:hypothetical protein